LPKQDRQVTCSVQAPQLSSRKLVERFSNPFSSSPEPSFTTATSTRPKSALHHRQDVQEVSLLPRHGAGKALPRQLRPIDADAKLFPPRAAAFPPLPGQPVRPSRRPLVAPFARPTSTSAPRPSAGSPARPVSVMARSTRLSVSFGHAASQPDCPGRVREKRFRSWLTAHPQQTGAVVDG
jgi:hypothetical protein